MGVIKKKRSHHGKASRQQYYSGVQVGGVGSMGAINNNIPSLTSFAEENNYQYGYSGSSAGMNGRSLTYAQQQLNKQRQDFERVRLRPEQLSNIIHDESDTISFRSNLLKNFISSNDAFNMLSLTTVPCDRIEKSRLFTAAEDGSRSTKDMIDAVFEQDSHLRYQPDPVVVHRDDPALVGKLRGDLREAPADYWTHAYGDVLAQYHEAKERIRQKEVTAGEAQDEASLQQQQQQVVTTVASQSPHATATEKEPVPAVVDDPLENMFGDYSNEPFNTNFDDEFGDLDAVFF
ncbi:CIC_collapsed_G0023450.mRNA.1.CDS.1 [Saccharomyces cerevisiae]|nr:CIC_collapsed_G0023450.mRNA.1.CDS.1 [Saccharomyces cerevisiae]